MQNFLCIAFVLPSPYKQKESGLKITRRRAWLLVFLFSVVVWGLLFAAIAYASNGDKVKPKSQPGENTQLVNVQKIKKLDLSEQQRKFVESLIESPEKKQNN